MMPNTATSIVTGASRTDTYFRSKEVDVSVYSVTGQAQPACVRIRARRKATEPWCRLRWLGWLETPWASKVRRMSIVAVGGCDVDVAAAVAVEVVDGEVVDEEEGANAEVSTEAILPASQVERMLSGKSAESRTKTSEGERRPRSRALESSSVLRTGPRELALPVFFFRRVEV